MQDILETIQSVVSDNRESSWPEGDPAVKAATDGALVRLWFEYPDGARQAAVLIPVEFGKRILIRVCGFLRGCASIDAMLEGRRIRTRTPEWRAIYDRIQVAMELTSRLNVLPFSDVDSRKALLSELFGQPLPDTATVHPPFYCTYGLGIELGERTFVGQACSFLDLGGITIGDRTLISPKVTLITEGHPVEAAERYDFITVAPIVVEAGVWIGAAATILPGVRIGHDSVVGAGAVVAKDVPALTVVSGPGHIERKHLESGPASER